MASSSSDAVTISVPREEKVGAGIATQTIATGPSAKHVVAAASSDLVPSVSTVEVVCTPEPEQEVIPAPTANYVRSGIAEENIISRTARYRTVSVSGISDGSERIERGPIGFGVLSEIAHRSPRMSGTVAVCRSRGIC
jgi:hypothetical protein